MKTTALIVEHLVGGIIAMSAALFALWAFLPLEIGPFLEARKSDLTKDAFGTVVAVALVSAAYAVGIAFDYGGRIAFEWWMDKTKARRFKKLRNTDRALLDAPILAGRLRMDDENNQRDAKEFYGLIRFYVKQNSVELSKEVESQTDRQRLLRTLALSAFTALAGVMWLAYQAASPRVFYALGGTGALSFLAVLAIGDRFDRYCRAIERSFRILETARASAQRSDSDPIEIVLRIR